MPRLHSGDCQAVQTPVHHGCAGSDQVNSVRAGLVSLPMASFTMSAAVPNRHVRHNPLIERNDSLALFLCYEYH